MLPIIPAIDLHDGRCVRLLQGDYARVTVFSDQPAQMAAHWEEEGAQLLHVVDLDGALHGHGHNLPAVREILRVVSIPVQLGGGLRSIEDVERVLDLGAERVVIGTAAVEDQAFLANACARWPGRVVVALDARNGQVATRGWQTDSGISAIELAQQVIRLGASRLLYTDIDRDGTLTEPNYTATADLVAAVPVPVIASGGVSHLEHLERLDAVGVEAAIVGRALYTGAIRIRDAQALP